MRSTCPLCGGAPVAGGEQIRFDDVWDAYRQQYATEFSPKVRQRYSGTVSLLRCAGCGLEWFDPALEGDAQFYSEMRRGDISYEPRRWEFNRAAGRIANGARLIEVGPGRGAFLQSVLDRCSTVQVYERNPDVLRELRDLGVEVLVGDIADALEGKADVVCAFQVLEHVADVRGFLEALARVCAPGGQIMVSVPNRNRYREGLAPRDCPPHHMSRWAPSQLRTAAEIVGLRLESLEFESPDLSQARAARQRPVRERLTPLVGARGADLTARAWAKLRMPQRRYGRLMARGGLARLGEFGHTMFAVMRRS